LPKKTKNKKRTATALQGVSKLQGVVYRGKTKTKTKNKKQKTKTNNVRTSEARNSITSELKKIRTQKTSTGQRFHRT
jgi:hypothetical protein